MKNSTLGLLKLLLLLEAPFAVVEVLVVDDGGVLLGSVVLVVVNAVLGILDAVLC